jgi:hypothetical protein
MKTYQIEITLKGGGVVYRYAEAVTPELAISEVKGKLSRSERHQSASYVATEVAK